jgi:hypothetical protein
MRLLELRDKFKAVVAELDRVAGSSSRVAESHKHCCPAFAFSTPLAINPRLTSASHSPCSFAFAIVLLNALSFASLAYIANRKGYHGTAALAAGGAWLFGAAGVLVWIWR